MNCPYPDCTRRGLSDSEGKCPQCSRFLARCRRRQCGEANRAFANFCRACGHELPREGLDWAGFKGGSERIGLNPYRNGQAIADVAAVHHLTLGDSCRSLLSAADHLIAVSVGGRIEVVGSGSRQRLAGWKIEGPVTCEPCVHRGSLYLAARGRLVAYTLGRLGSGGSHPEPRWEVAISGTPIQALLAIGDRLYFNVGYTNRRLKEVRVVDGIGGQRPVASEPVAAGESLSMPAGGAKPRRRIVFLSEEGGRLRVYRADHADNARPQVTSHEVSGAPDHLKHFVPIAAVRNKIFAVFGSDSKLCTIDAERSVFGSVIQEDVQSFALSGPSDGVLLQGGALFFLYRNRREPLTPDDRINGQPVIVDGRAVFVGMKDGRVRWYDLSNPAVIGQVHLADQAEEVTALASFGDYVAAGGSRGTVRLFHLEGKE